jgi:tetratricopeptide (TPR) repeat protein
LDDTLAEAHTSLAFLQFDNSPTAAENEFKRAIELNPSYATAHHWYSDFLAMHGRDDEAMGEIETAVGLDPVSPIIIATMGERLFYARRYDEAIRSLRQAAEMDDKFFVAHFILGMVYEQKGMYSEAIAEFQDVRSMTRQQPEYEAMLAHALAVSGNKKEAEKILAGLLKNCTYPHAVAIIYLGLGDNRRAIKYLKKIDDAKSKWSLKTDPRLDPLRSYPEFKDLLPA